MYYIAPDDELPGWLVYPPLFHKLVQHGLVNWCPWHIAPANDMRVLLYDLEQCYPGRKLYPFACRHDTNDVACWEAGRGESVFVVQQVNQHDSPAQIELPNMAAWLVLAMQNMIDWH